MPLRVLPTLLLLALLAAGAPAGEDPWTHYAADRTAGLPGNEIQMLEEGPGGRIWVGTLNGLCWWTGEGFESLQDDEGQTLDVSVWDVLVTGEETYWVGHSKGVTRVGPAGRESFLAGSTVSPVLPYGEGELWAVGKQLRTEVNTLYRYAPEDGWQPVERFAEERVADLYRAADGHLWVTIDGNGVYEVDPAAGPEAAVHHLEGYNVTALHQAPNGTVWCGLWGRGVMAWDGESWTRHLPEEDAAILAITSDAKGNIWVATSAHGLWRKPFNAPEWRNDLREEGAINLLAATGEGRIWVSSQMQGGLRYWDAEAEAWKVGLASPLPIRTVLRAADGSIWAGGVLDGLHVLPAAVAP
jgi:ligand-binding sensor domain-containing protein